MKKFKMLIMGLIIILIIVVLNKCCDYEQNSLADVVVEKMYGYKFDDSEIPELGTITEVMNFIHQNIEYVDETRDYWQLPEQTWEFKGGDCEDLCLLFMYLLQTRLGIKSTLCLVKHPKKNTHALVKIEDKYYELVHNTAYYQLLTGWYVEWEALYEESIWMTYHYHNNVGIYY